MIRIIVQIVSNLATELYGSKMKRVLIGYRGKKIGLPYPFCSIEKRVFFRPYNKFFSTQPFSFIGPFFFFFFFFSHFFEHMKNAKNTLSRNLRLFTVNVFFRWYVAILYRALWYLLIG